MGRKETPFNNPFSSLGKTLKKELEEKAKPAPVVAPVAKPKPQEKSDEATFMDAMRGIDRLGGDQRGRRAAPEPPDANELPLFDEDAEALAELVHLVDGTAKFDIADSDEFIEGSISGLDRRVLSSLRRGDFAVRAHLDLHGMTRDVARDAVENFVLRARRENLRCVLIVHGRGLNSKDKIPVLKTALHAWLERGKIARSVLAFCTARPHDGGAGAVYVLMRRSRDK